MKIFLKIMLVNIIVCIIIFNSNSVFGTERLVDIPVPPDNHGFADFSDDDSQESKNDEEINQNEENITDNPNEEIKEDNEGDENTVQEDENVENQVIENNLRNGNIKIRNNVFGIIVIAIFFIMIIIFLIKNKGKKK